LLERIKRGERKRMNRIVREGRLPEKPVELPFAEAEDEPDCE
jgi:hypothetical protein